MALPVTAVFLVILSFFASCAAQQNCSEVQCELLPVGEDFASEFQFKASEMGVRMVYLNLMIGNDSYQPLELGNEFLPERWVWASSIGELMLSLSYDYDILSLGLLKSQVRMMNVQLKQQPNGCLKGLNSSCYNKVVGRVLLGNVTAAKNFRQDVVCVAEINDQMNVLEKIVEGNVEYRCCKVAKQGFTDAIKCEQPVECSTWYKAFYAVLNILTGFVAIYSPVLLLGLLDFLVNLRKEYKKEKEDKSRRTEEPWKRFLDAVGWQQTPNKIDDYEPLPGSTIENIAITEITSIGHKEKTSALPKKEDQLPVDDGSPFTFSRLLDMCNSGTEVFQGLVKFSFNIKLVILWYFVMPIFFLIEFALFETIKDEFSEEVDTKRKAHLVGILFFRVNITFGILVTLIVSYVLLPFFVIMMLKKEDFIEKGKPCPICDEKPPRYIGKEVWNHLEIIPKVIILVIPFVAKFPIIFWLGFQIFCTSWLSCYDDRLTRFSRLMSSCFALIVAGAGSVVTAVLTACVWILFLFSLIMVVIICTPQFTILIFVTQKGLKVPFYFFSFLIVAVTGGLIFAVLFQYPLTYPILFILFLMIYPIFLGLHSCRFIVRMFGYTIIGLTLNAEIASPVVTFIWLVTSYMYECLCNFQSLYKDIKQMIFQEWQEIIKELAEEVRPKSTNNTIPTEVFWYVCNESEVLPVWPEMFRMFGNVTVIFLSAFFALSIILFGTNKYQIPTVASTIAVFVCGKFPMLFLREMHKLNFIGWRKIERKEKVKESVREFFTKKYGFQRKRCATI